MFARGVEENRRVLVADDERHLVRLLQVNLERQGYRVTCAYGGREAIERLTQEDFDLAVIDRDMPDLSGHEVIAWIRANERTKDLRVILLGDEDDEDGVDPPPPGVLVLKPFQFSDLFRWGSPD